MTKSQIFKRFFQVMSCQRRVNLSIISKSKLRENDLRIKLLEQAFHLTDDVSKCQQVLNFSYLIRKRTNFFDPTVFPLSEQKKQQKK